MHMHINAVPALGICLLGHILKAKSRWLIFVSVDK